MRDALHMDMPNLAPSLIFQRTQVDVSIEELTSSDVNRVRSFNNGDSYVWEYRDDKTDGRGVYKLVDGGSYEGEFKGGMKHGRGVYVSVTGDTYTGEYKKDKKHGKGVSILAFGDVYDGESSVFLTF